MQRENSPAEFSEPIYLSQGLAAQGEKECADMKRKKNNHERKDSFLPKRVHTVPYNFMAFSQGMLQMLLNPSLQRFMVDCKLRDWQSGGSQLVFHDTLNAREFRRLAVINRKGSIKGFNYILTLDFQDIM